MSQTVTCRYCGALVSFDQARLPLICSEHDVDGEPSFVMIGRDDWVLHRCVIARAENDQVGEGATSPADDPKTR